MRSALSIDWDFFFDCIPFNGGLGEFYEETIWCKRVPTGLSIRLKGFWENLAGILQFSPNCSVVVTEDHYDSYDLLADYQHLIVFDAHSDCYSDRDLGRLHTGNWLRVWCERRAGKAILVFRNQNDVICETGVLDQILAGLKPEALSYQDFLRVGPGIPTEVERIHICRSSAWTHPFYDDVFFSQLVDGSPGLKSSYLLARNTPDLTFDEFMVCLNGDDQIGAFIEHSLPL